MNIKTREAVDRCLLDATLEYVASHRDKKMDIFRENVANWGTKWSDVTPAHLAASDIFEGALALSKPATPEGELMSSFARERASRHWEQTYTNADKAVGGDMLANYGYAEIIGKRGPFVSERVRAGFGVFGPSVNYPPHRHMAEEIYAILAGSAHFFVGEDPKPDLRRAGDIIYIPSMRTHGFRTTDEPLICFYLWQGGDLREKSTFV